MHSESKTTYQLAKNLLALASTKNQEEAVIIMKSASKLLEYDSIAKELLDVANMPNRSLKFELIALKILTVE